MPADEPTPTPPSLRQRRRTVATREIVDAAGRHIAEHGAAALSLRAVARGLGMTAQALYHYFPNRNALVTVLIAEAYQDLAAALQAAVDGLPDGPAEERFLAVTEEYRHWSISHPERFQLLYGTPLRDYAAPAEGPTTQAVRQLGMIFQRELFSGATPAQLAAAETLPLSSSLQTYVERHMVGPSLPPAALALMLSAWGHMHGLVVLEVFGHTSFVGEHQAEIFRMAMRDLLTDIHRRLPAAQDGPPPAT